MSDNTIRTIVKIVQALRLFLVGVAAYFFVNDFYAGHWYWFVWVFAGVALGYSYIDDKGFLR